MKIKPMKKGERQMLRMIAVLFVLTVPAHAVEYRMEQRIEERLQEREQERETRRVQERQDEAERMRRNIDRHRKEFDELAEKLLKKRQQDQEY